MSNTILIVGQSGSGKTTSIRNLDHTSTFIISVINKALPFPGWKKKYTDFVKHEDGTRTGNRYISDDAMIIPKVMEWVSNKMPHIKTIIIDDAQYLMANEFMRRAKEKGYEKFTDIGMKFWGLVNDAQNLRDDLNIYIIMHEDEDSQTRIKKAKTIGRMLDDKITLEGMFTIVLFSVVEDGKYFFNTQSDGFNLAKSPMGMFEETKITNDLLLVEEAINKYDN